MPNAVQPISQARILIVDDEDDTARVLGRALERHGCRVRRAASVDEALSLVDDWKPDLVVSDYSMPGRTGGDLLEALADHCPDLITSRRFVFLTGHPDLARLHAAPRDLTVIAKPYRLDEVRHLILTSLGLAA